MSPQSKRTQRHSLARRVVGALVLGEIVFAIVLGSTIGLYSARSAAQQRQSHVGEMSGVIAASIMPIVADQQGAQVRAQLGSILETAEVRDVECIRLVDSSGNAIAAGDEDCDCDTPIGGRQSLIQLLTATQVVAQPVVVDGLEVARVYVQFAPVGLAEAVRQPALAATIVALLVVLVSAPWTSWVFMRTVIEPLEDVGEAAMRVADGNLDLQMETERDDEIGELQNTLTRMARQLKDRDDRLRLSYSDLAVAYNSLEKAKDEIELLSRIKSDFVAVASHELRTPLATIRIYAETLERGEVCELDEAGLDAVAAIGAAADRLTSIVSDLMDSALLERGMLQMAFGDVWVQDLIEKSVADAGLNAQSREMSVGLDGEVPDMTIRGDAVRLRQVLDNLLSNALKYSEPESRVSVRATEDQDGLTIEVADEGRGISVDDRDRLFSLFGRLDVRDSRDTAGLGLGLAISARIVEAHGGRITFRDNEAGRGSVFAVWLPRDAAGANDTGVVRVVSGEVESA